MYYDTEEAIGRAGGEDIGGASSPIRSAVVLRHRGSHRTGGEGEEEKEKEEEENIRHHNRHYSLREKEA